MANFYIAEIPLSEIDHIQLYINTHKKTLAQIKTATGADLLLNGGLYSMTTYKPVVHTKADGVIYGSSSWNGMGIAWNTNDPYVLWLPADYKSYLEGNILIHNGEPQTLNYNAAQGGKRGRTAIGLKAGCLCLYCTKDGSTASRTPEKLKDDLVALGWTDALMLDSGGSSQCDFRGDKITSTRKVQNLILVYLKKGNCPYAEPTSIVKKGTRGNGAKWVQWYLNKWGASLIVDGIFGGLSHAALIKFQTDHGLVPDGLCGSLTRAKLKE